MHHVDKAREDNGVTKYETVDTIKMVECLVKNIGQNRGIELSHATEDLKIDIKVKAW